VFTPGGERMGTVPLGDKFNPWEPGVKLRMALYPADTVGWQSATVGWRQVINETDFDSVAIFLDCLERFPVS
jgi:hypothetical protein